MFYHLPVAFLAGPSQRFLEHGVRRGRAADWCATSLSKAEQVIITEADWGCCPGRWIDELVTDLCETLFLANNTFPRNHPQKRLMYMQSRNLSMAARIGSLV